MGRSPLLEGPLAVAFAWDGRLLQVLQLTAPGLTVSGQLATVTLPATDLAEITAMDLDVQLTGYDLRQLNVLSPIETLPALQGYLDFAGQLRGSPSQPQCAGGDRAA
jgi:translocation and assembly module TamB